MRRQSMKKYQGISILFFSRQSKGSFFFYQVKAKESQDKL